jgi:serine/threonine-protein kinase
MTAPEDPTQTAPDARPAGTVDAPPVAGPPAPLPAASRYQMLRLHASGGLGEVHLADDTELHRPVALKRLRADDPGSRCRFWREAEITARLQHPGVVPVYGLAADADGRPAYVMRFIEGEPLSEAIRRFHGGRESVARRYHGVEFRQLLQHFIAACNAAAYAHSRGVVHRDLKPANIMLGRFGETLVVDWGVARTVEHDEADRAGGEATLRATVDATGERTLPGSVVGTPAYMSPEQAAGRWDVLGPASDIYGLGAVLYCLLTGWPPIANDSWPAMQQRIRRGDYPAPRQVHPAAPAALEAVALRAMALEPADRYGSALELAEEVQRWLADEPVTAYREPWRERARRWVKRHRPLVTGAAAALLAGVVSLAAATVLLAAANERERRAKAGERAARREVEEQRDRALAARARTRAALDAMTSEVAGDSLTTQPALSEEQRRFLTSVLGYYEEFAAEPGEEREGRERRALAHYRLGQIRTRLGQREEATDLFRRSAEFYERLAADDPAAPEYPFNQAASLGSRGKLLAELGRRPEAEAALRRAIELYERLAADHPAAPQYRRELAVGLGDLGNLLSELGQRPAAAAAYRRMAALGERLAADDPAATDYRRILAAGLTNLGTLLYELGQPAEAVSAYRRAVEVQERLATDPGAVPEYRHDLAAGLGNLGNVLLSLSRHAEAEAAYRRAIAIRERLAADYPAVPGYRRSLAMGFDGMGSLLYLRGKRPEAEAAYRHAIELRERLAAEHPAVPSYRRDLASSLHNLGNVLRDLAKGPEAEATYRRAIAIGERLADEHPGVPEYAVGLGGSYCNLGHLLKDRGEPQAALEWYARALARLQPVAAAGPGLMPARTYLRASHRGRAAALADLGRHAEAVPDWDRAIELDDGPMRDAFRLRRADCLARSGEVARAAAEAEALAQSPGASAAALYNCACVLSLAAARPTPDADRHAARAVDVLRRAVARGYGDVAHLLKDPDLDLLRRRDDYAALLWDLADLPPARPAPARAP